MYSSTSKAQNYAAVRFIFKKKKKKYKGSSFGFHFARMHSSKCVFHCLLL